jgi:hypothetical protein
VRAGFGAPGRPRGRVGGRMRRERGRHRQIASAARAASSASPPALPACCAW